MLKISLIAIIPLLMLLIPPESIAKENEESLSTTERTVLKKERAGIKAHRRGQYKKAYKNLYESAIWGRKDSQYFLALMYLKGQHINQDTIIGMGLLAVANEVDIKERKELYKTIYNALSESEKTQVDKKAEQYIENFGMKAKRMTCSNAYDLGSRKKVVDCHTHNSRIKGKFVID